MSHVSLGNVSAPREPMLSHSRPVIATIERGSSSYPKNIEEALGDESPRRIFAIGSREILEARKVALFCSSKCPGTAILRTYDLAQRLRAEGRTVISGFHSPMEKECLEILLRSPNRVLLCPARGLGRIRIRREWKKSIADHRLLMLSPFPSDMKRGTAKDGYYRNLFVAALADEVFLAHSEPGSRVDQLRTQIREWGKPVRVLSNENS